MDHFFNLTPDIILAALESQGFITTGGFRQLNSYENRVFDIEIENEPRIIAKFYRPGRWNQDAILDEHNFLWELKSEGIPVVAPIKLKNDKTLFEYEEIKVSLFPRVVGRNPQEFLPGELKKVGRRLAQIHNVGARTKSKNRLLMDVANYGYPDLNSNLKWIAPEMIRRYEAAALAILEHLEPKLSSKNFIRIHGDCHKGNLINDGTEFMFVDFDDFCNGSPAQDFWMLFGGDEDEIHRDQSEIILGYEELREFNDDWIKLFSPLRGLRMIHYAAWIIKRWEDPSFPRLFPEFNTYRYWAEETEALERIAWKL
jgi:Ser/Thr protein kinase RdoA (MazF antagonist)